MMADCYYHGYSGGPGGCSLCIKEREQGLDQGEGDEVHDQEVTTHDWKHGRYPRQGNP